MRNEYTTIFAVLACIASVVSGFSTKQAPRAVVGKLYSQQPEYGQSLELPDTYAHCGRCETAFAIKEDDLGGGRGR